VQKDYKNAQKKQGQIVENEENCKKSKKFFKRVWTNAFLYGKLWENLTV